MIKTKTKNSFCSDIKNWQVWDF